jgi:hypothetical protein
MRNLVIAALAAVMLSGCASATRGWEETLSIASTPAGATATLSGPSAPITCTTPCAVQVKRSDDVTVSFELPGYEPQIIPLTKEIATTGAAGFAGNLLLGGVIGMGVDAATSAALDHKPNPVIAKMRPLPRAPEPRALLARKPKPRQPPAPDTGT